jgi:TonB family protein
MRFPVILAVAFLALAIRVKAQSTSDWIHDGLAGQAAANRTGQPARLDAFTIAQENGNGWLILEAQRSSESETRVRFIQAYPACGSFRVQAVEYVFESTTPQDLAGKADLCVREDSVKDLAHWAHKRGEFNTSGRQGITAVCGTRTNVYQLPDRGDVYFEVMAVRGPGVAAMWGVAERILDRYKDREGKSVFSKPASNNTYLSIEEWRQQHLPVSLSAATRIRNGDFDLALPSLSEYWARSGHAKLSDLIPAPEEAAGPGTDFGEIVAADRLGLTKVDPVFYPHMARIAHIQGDVELEVAIDHSGTVTSSTALMGHPILRAASMDAAAKWIFAFPYTGPNPLPVKIHFEMHCPVLVETTSTHTARAKKTVKSNKKKQAK